MADQNKVEDAAPPHELEEQAPVEIHKPKPWHGFREFLKEYLVIVVGVLTALGGEAVVENLHWRQEAARAEQDLASGLQPDLLNAATILGAGPCFQSWLKPLGADLQTPAADWRAAPLNIKLSAGTATTPVVFAVPGYVWSHAAWESASTSGVLNHMPEDRAQRYAELYRLVDLVRAQVVTASDTADELAPLGVNRRVTESEKAAYLQRVAHLERIVRNQARLSRQILQGAHELGVDPPGDKLRARIAEQRSFFGDCVADVKLPLG